jgi:hypothetical protein
MRMPPRISERKWKAATQRSEKRRRPPGNVVTVPATTSTHSFAEEAPHPHVIFLVEGHFSCPACFR